MSTRPALGLAAALALAPGPAPAGEALPLADIRLPAGFGISLFTDAAPNARSLTLGAQGTVFIGSRHAGRVYAAVDADDDGRAETVHVVAEGLTQPNGVAFRDGALYVAEIDRILRFDAIETRLDDPPAPVVVHDGLPEATHHGWRYIGFGPHGRLHVSIGVPCNVCDEPGHGVILRMNADGTDRETFARGVRNSVGFDWHPETGHLWFTDNGRDWMGDDRPPDELNHAPAPGLHFGFPYCHGRDLPDPVYGAGHDCADYTAPAAEFGAHVAALGMRFYTGAMFPETYHGQILIAQHGSWNRSEKVGYRVIRARLDGDEVVETAPFAEGWLQGDEAWGRPVDVLVMPDGAVLVSDDKAGAVYRISYGG